jgi:hypothetical protein
LEVADIEALGIVDLKIDTDVSVYRLARAWLIAGALLQ